MNKVAKEVSTKEFCKPGMALNESNKLFTVKCTSSSTSIELKTRFLSPGLHINRTLQFCKHHHVATLFAVIINAVVESSVLFGDLSNSLQIT